MHHIVISIRKQSLDLFDGQKLICSYPVSTARNGAGEMNGSGCTPRGLHIIRAKIGAGLPLGSIFKARRATGEIYNEKIHNPKDDWILTRILWLSGLEPGKNRLGNVDTMRRYIYIHGTPDSEPVGVAASHGCIRMRNHDLIDLFDKTDVGCRVEIIDE